MSRHGIPGPEVRSPWQRKPRDRCTPCALLWLAGSQKQETISARKRQMSYRDNRGESQTYFIYLFVARTCSTSNVTGIKSLGCTTTHPSLQPFSPLWTVRIDFTGFCNLSSLRTVYIDFLGSLINAAIEVTLGFRSVS